MITEIDKEQLNELIKSFYNLTGIKVAVYNSNFMEILAYPNEHSSFCAMMHNNKYTCEKCAKSMENLCSKCALEKNVIIEKCHAGLTEVIAPLSDGISVLGYIMFGQITNEADRNLFTESVIKRCENYRFDKDDLCTSLEDILYYSDVQLDDASKILKVLGGYIVFNRFVYSSENSVAQEIAQYIRGNLDKDLSVKELCAKFHFSKSEIYKITKLYMPKGIASFVREQRMEKAVQLLRTTNMPSWQIAQKVGFSDVNYFLRIFKSEMNISASKFRRKHNNC